MSRPILKIISLLGFVSILLHSQISNAQKGPASKQFFDSGMIISVAPGQIVMKTSKSRLVLVKFPRPGSDRVTISGTALNRVNTTIAIQGKLHSSRLVKGMYVRFTTKLNDQFEVIGEIKNLDIVGDITGKNNPGMFPKNAPGSDQKQASVSDTSYMIIAKIVKISPTGVVLFSIPKSKLNPKGKLKGTISKDAVLPLSTANLKYAKAKFKIQVTGIVYGSQVLAEYIVIDFPESYAQPLKKKTVKKKKTRKKKKAKTKKKKFNKKK